MNNRCKVWEKVIKTVVQERRWEWVEFTSSDHGFMNHLSSRRIQKLGRISVKNRRYFTEFKQKSSLSEILLVSHGTYFSLSHTNKKKS